MKATWYSIRTFGDFNTDAFLSAETAWNAWDAWKRVAGLHEHEIGSEKARTHATLYAGTTRRAVLNADVSVHRGQVGRGEFWRVDAA